MAYSKVVLNGTTLIDLTQKTVDADKLLNGYTALKNDGTDITGTYTPPQFVLQSKSASYTPSETAQSGTITPDSGYDGLDEVSVSVGAISPSYVGSGVTRISSHIYTPTTTDQVINAGQYIDGVQRILGDANLIAGNIKKDVSIFSITGTYEGQSYQSASGVSF